MEKRIRIEQLRNEDFPLNSEPDFIKRDVSATGRVNLHGPSPQRKLDMRGRRGQDARWGSGLH